MAPTEDHAEQPDAQAALHGSGDLSLEIEITKMRQALMRLVTEMDRFCDEVRGARMRIEQIHRAMEEENVK
jgi:hypothetical protein